MNSNNARFYIDGAWVSPAVPKSFDFVNPATEEPIGAIGLGPAQDVDRAVVAARKAFATYSQTSKQERLALLRQIIAAYKRGSTTSPLPLLRRWDRRFGFPKRSRLRPHWTILKKSVACSRLMSLNI